MTILSGGDEHDLPVGGPAGDPRAALADLAAATGWEVKPVGLCRGDVCVPTATLEVDDDGSIALDHLASLTGQMVEVDLDRDLAAFGPGLPPAGVAAGAPAPPIRLADLDGQAFDAGAVAGRKKLVVSFASWCGCAHDLPGWQAVADELADDGLSVVAVAIDEDPEAVRPFTGAVSFPVLIDPDRTFTDDWGIVNVPTVVWVDEDDRVVRAQDVAFGTDTFREFTKVDSAPHHDALRRWVRDGADPEPPAAAGSFVPTEDHLRARLHFRMATSRWRRGDRAGAEEHFARAAELAPWDFTIRRAQLPLLDKDPFLGDEFLELYQAWEDAGRPRYGQSTGVADD